MGVSITLFLATVLLCVRGGAMQTTEEPRNCSCAALYVTGPSSNKDIVGIYTHYSCLIADRQVYVHNDGSVFLLYNETMKVWAFSDAPDLSGVSFVESLKTEAMLPFEVSGVWQAYGIGSGWQSSNAITVQCICEKPVCENVTINSTDEANTFFPEGFAYHSEYNDRPAYYNAAEGVYLYFHSRANCHMWAVSTAINANRWLMYSYDISPRPHEIVAPWNVARTSSWVEDTTLYVKCIE